MKNIIVFSGSNSSNSINKQLLLSASKKLELDSVQYVDLSEYDAPVFGEDLEKEAGIPTQIRDLKIMFSNADGFMISIPEHNGLLPAFFKNILDWLSRIDQNIFYQINSLLKSEL